MSDSAPPSREWICGPEALAILACSRLTLSRLAESNLIRTLRIPGAWPRFSRTDCERVAEESTSKLVSPSR